MMYLTFMQHCRSLDIDLLFTIAHSLVPRPFKSPEEKGPGTHCAHALGDPIDLEIFVRKNIRHLLLFMKILSR